MQWRFLTGHASDCSQFTANLAIARGIVALLLETSPTLTPDQVKCRLLASSASLVGKNGKAAYSVFQQGVGLVNAYNAVYSQAANCANQGLNPSGPNPAAGGANGSPPAVSHGRG
jgi:hypothetical protein